MDKEIQCKEPCWHDKAIQDELLVFFMLDLLCSSPRGVKSAIVKYASCHSLDSYIGPALQGFKAYACGYEAII